MKAFKRWLKEDRLDEILALGLVTKLVNKIRGVRPRDINGEKLSSMAKTHATHTLNTEPTPHPPVKLGFHHVADRMGHENREMRLHIANHMLKKKIDDLKNPKPKKEKVAKAPKKVKATTPDVKVGKEAAAQVAAGRSNVEKPKPVKEKA